MDNLLSHFPIWCCTVGILIMFGIPAMVFSIMVHNSRQSKDDEM